MSEINNGGPAFPTLVVVGDMAQSDGGLTLRDYFAAHVDIPLDFATKVAAATLGMSQGDISVDQVLEVRANLKLIEADAMLAARVLEGGAS